MTVTIAGDVLLDVFRHFSRLIARNETTLPLVQFHKLRLADDTLAATPLVPSHNSLVAVIEPTDLAFEKNLPEILNKVVSNGLTTFCHAGQPDRNIIVLVFPTVLSTTSPLLSSYRGPRWAIEMPNRPTTADQLRLVRFWLRRLSRVAFAIVHQHPYDAAIFNPEMIRALFHVGQWHPPVRLHVNEWKGGDLPQHFYSFVRHHLTADTLRLYLDCPPPNDGLLELVLNGGRMLRRLFICTDLATAFLDRIIQGVRMAPDGDAVVPDFDFTNLMCFHGYGHWMEWPRLAGPGISALSEATVEANPDRRSPHPTIDSAHFELATRAETGRGGAGPSPTRFCVSVEYPRGRQQQDLLSLRIFKC